MSKETKKSAFTGTEYISDFEFHLVTRNIRLGNGNVFVEPTWVGSEKLSGPMLFVSPIEAEIFRIRCNNKNHHDDPRASSNWKRVKLNKFDLYEHALACDDEQVICMLVFGFSATLRGELIAPRGTPRSLYIPLPFSPPKDTRPTFSFNGWVFDFMREQWNAIGAPQYAQQLEELSKMSDAEVNALAKEATEKIAFSSDEPDDADWGVFLLDQKKWKFGPPEPRQIKELH